MQSKFSAGWSIVANEKKAELLFKKLDFTLTAKVDLIMKNENEYAIIDYKTGEPPSAKEVNAGFDPQLPLSGYLLNKGAFIDIGPVTVTKLDYVRVKAKLGAKGVETQLGVKKGSLTIDELISDGAHNLEKLVTEFDKRETIYYCQPRLKYTYDYSDYDHLARRNEWVRLASDVDA